VFVAGMAAAARAQDISARFLELLVARLEQVWRVWLPRCSHLAVLLAPQHATCCVSCVPLARVLPVRAVNAGVRWR
jgi:hypothetical protein